MEPTEYSYVPNGPNDASRVAAKRRGQVSLRTSLIIVAFAVLAVSHVKSTLDLRAARTRLSEQSAEIDKLRGELGIFEIEDPAKTHLLFIRRNQPDSFRYRVYLPPRQREYEICVTTKDVSLSYLPDETCQRESLRAGGVIPIEGTPFFVDVFLAKDRDGEYHWHVQHPRGEIVERFVPIAKGGQSHISSGNSSGRVVLSDPDEPIVLVRWIPVGEVGAAPGDGLAVWIQ
jgi:hypothetical protein